MGSTDADSSFQSDLVVDEFDWKRLEIFAKETRKPGAGCIIGYDVSIDVITQFITSAESSGGSSDAFVRRRDVDGRKKTGRTPHLVSLPTPGPRRQPTAELQDLMFINALKYMVTQN